eukprot:3820398-Prymnesium_polylepis.1
MSMWQSYAVKRQTIVMREKKAVGDVADDASRCEKVARGAPTGTHTHTCTYAHTNPESHLPSKK